MKETQSVAAALQEEIKRVRDEVIPAYEFIGAAGVPAMTMMRASMDASTKALAEGDAVACIGCLKDLRGYSV